MKLYIAGPMTGHPEHNYPAFHAAETHLRSRGYHVHNPARHHHPHPNPTWLDWMRLAIAGLITCDAIATLPDWHTSRGARTEVALANDLGLTVAPLDAWGPRPIDPDQAA